MDALPPELILHLIPLLPLKTLIAARGVSTRWRSYTQMVTLHPARKVLLDLYLAAIVHPNFSSLVEVLRPEVYEFDREAYITDLTSRGCVLPEVFELWILEWPSKAIHFWAWPGLRTSPRVHHEYYWGGNSLSASETTLSPDIPVLNEVASAVESCCAVLLWKAEWFERGVACLWLVVDGDERINDKRAGRLLWTHAVQPLTFTGSGYVDSHISLDILPFRADTLVEFLSLLDLSHMSVDDARSRMVEAEEAEFLGRGLPTASLIPL